MNKFLVTSGTLLVVSGTLYSAPSALAAEISPRGWSSTLAGISSSGKTGWVTSDGFSSVKLSKNKTLFLTGDALFGTRKGNKFTGGLFKRNTASVYNKKTNRWSSLKDKGASGKFPQSGNPSDRWFWPGSPSKYGNVIAVPLADMYRVPGPNNGFNFAQAGSALKTYRWVKNDLRLRSSRSMTMNKVQPDPAVASLITWTSTLMDGPWVYLFGTSLRKGPYIFGHDIFLARVPTAEYFAKKSNSLDDKTQFLSISGWSSDATWGTLKPIVTGQSDAAVSAIHTETGYHLVTKRNSILGNTIVDFHMANLEQDAVATDLAVVPTRANTWSYGACLQPSLGTDGHTFWTTINYNSNGSFNFFNQVSFTRPGLVKVTLP